MLRVGRVKRRVVGWFSVAVVCWPIVAKAELPRFRLGAALEARSDSERVVLGDGRLLQCSNGACETLDPTTGQRGGVAGDPGSLSGAIALDDGTLLLASGRAFDPSNGALSDLPASGHDLSRLRGVPLSSGRAAFWFSEDSGHCRRLLLFYGRSAGFREVEAAQGRSCVAAAHDLGEQRLLVTTRVPSSSGYDLSFAIHDLRTGGWQSGPRLSRRRLLSAFGYAGGALIFLARDELLSKGSNQVEAWFLARDGQRRAVGFERRRLDDPVARLGEHEFLLSDTSGSYLWNARGSGHVTPIPFPAPRMSERREARRGDELVLFDAGRSGYALVLSRRVMGPVEPCDRVFDYARSVVASDLPQLFSPSELEALLPEDDACYAWLDRQERLPEPFQSQLDALLTRSAGTPPTGEVIAAELACKLQPGFVASAIAKLNQSKTLQPFSVDRRCRNAAEAAPVLAAARASADVGGTLLAAGLQRDGTNARVAEWVVPWLRSRSRLRRYAAPLLHAARLHRASGLDPLHHLLCIEAPAPGVRCTELPPEPEPEWRTRERNRALKRFAVITGVLGGLGALAYVGRDGDLGRGIAVGTGVVAGAGAGFVITVSAGQGGDTSGLGALLLAFPVSILTGVAGGVIASKTSKEPGAARFATAAVPLAIAELATVVVTLDDL
jgi:hypothetical protein